MVQEIGERRGRSRFGQALVEFAVVFPILLILIMTLIEVSRIFQAYLALGYAARAAARFAVTGSPPMLISQGEESCQQIGHPGTGDPYSLPSQYQQCRVDWIKHIAREAARTGLLVSDLETNVSRPYFLGVYVRGYASFGGSAQSDFAGSPRTTVEITVVYNHPITNPFFSVLVPTVRINRTMRMVNEPWDGGGPEVPPAMVTATPLPPLDSDGDGWSDIDERDIYGTLPGNPDTDYDGYFDGTGILTPLDPTPLDPCVPDPNMCIEQ